MEIERKTFPSKRQAYKDNKIYLSGNLSLQRKHFLSVLDVRKEEDQAVCRDGLSIITDMRAARSFYVLRDPTYEYMKLYYNRDYVLMQQILEQ